MIAAVWLGPLVLVGGLLVPLALLLTSTERDPQDRTGPERNDRPATAFSDFATGF